MARTPSMTAQEAESALGARGSLRVTSGPNGNREIVRKWLTAQGFPALFCGGLSLVELAMAYNDTSGAGIEKLRRKLADCGADSDDTVAPDSAPTDAPVATSAPTAAPADKTAAALQVLRDLFDSNKAGLDADGVRAIIRDELPGLIPVTKIEIKTPAATRTIDVGLHHKQLSELTSALACGLNVALVGPAGSGKTTAFEQAAKILERKPYIQGAVQGAYELTGSYGLDGHYHTTPFRQSFQHGGLACLDELDGGDAAGLLVVNSATANCYMTFPDSPEPVRKHDQWACVACLNTFGNGADRLYVGRNQLDAATLDRFVFINWRYDEKLERAIAGNDSWVDRVQALRRGADNEKARVVISPRASINGAKLLAAGWTRSAVEDVTIWKGADAELRRRIETAAAA